MRTAGMLYLMRAAAGEFGPWPGVRLYVGADPGTVQGRRFALTGPRMFNGSYGPNSKFDANELASIDGWCDSGAFNDKPEARLTPDGALDRQLAWERRHVHTPRVEAVEDIQGRVDVRNENRKKQLLRFMEAVSHCGTNATAYAVIRYKDRAGRLADVLFFVCRRPNWSGWCLKDGRKVEDAHPTFVYEEMPIPYCLYIENGRRSSEVLRPGYRWQNSFEFIDVPEVATAEQLRAAQEKRRAKALGKQAQEAKLLAEWKRKNETPDLFESKGIT